MSEFCGVCGQLQNDETTESLWSIYNRLPGGHRHQEPLVFSSDWMQENVIDEEDHAALMQCMNRDMAQRGLCTGCGRPDLRGVNPEDVMSEEEARELGEMYAEQAAEIRAGC